MKKLTAFILVVLLVAGVAIAVTALVLKRTKSEEKQRIEKLSSDVVSLHDSVRLAGDAWVGYSVFRSERFVRSMEGEGIGVVYTDDNADYPGRMKKLADGEYDMIVSTLDAYLVNAQAYDYPGVIIFVVDESKGGDGIVAAEGINEIGDLARPDVKIALTPNSPSDFFLRSVASHFDLTSLKAPGAWRIATEGSEDALKKLRGGAVQAAVLWEPELTEAISDQRFHKLITTEKTSGLIVDICIARRQFVVEHPEIVQTLTRQYFQALRYYQSDEAAFRSLAARDAQTTEDKAERMLAGVNFASLAQNANRWYGLGAPDVAREELLDSVRSNVEVLIETGALAADPLNGSPRRLINSSFVQQTLQNPGAGKATSSVFGDGPAVDATPALINFRELSGDEWAKLKVIGKLKVRPIYFQTSTSLLTLDGKRAIDRIAEDIEHYPSYRLLVKGHTKPEGDEQQNLVLSRQRAEAVANYLVRVHDIPATRVHAAGVGGAEPLPQEADESYRRWSGRLPRVELWLVEDPSL